MLHKAPIFEMKFVAVAATLFSTQAVHLCLTERWRQGAHAAACGAPEMIESMLECSQSRVEGKGAARCCASNLI